MSDVRAFRKNIIAYAKGSGASYRAFQHMEADAWITWPNWPITKADTLDMVVLSHGRTIWRDVNVAFSSDADPAAQAFLEFMVSEDAARLMATEGWVR